MFRKLLMVPVLAAGLGLSACNTTTDAAAVSAQIANAQRIAVSLCGYLPAVSTVVSLISVFSPQVGPFVDVANQVATSVCSAVTNKSARRGSMGVFVQGVRIQGRFVR